MNRRVLPHLHPEQVEVEIWRADELEVRRGLSSELDEMWSYVRSKAHPRWLWHAIDHHTGKEAHSRFPGYAAKRERGELAICFNMFHRPAL